MMSGGLGGRMLAARSHERIFGRQDAKLLVRSFSQAAWCPALRIALQPRQCLWLEVGSLAPSPCQLAGSESWATQNRTDFESLCP